jgi:hypothetical protein
MTETATEVVVEVIMTLTEIEKECDGEWILLENPYEDER